jgi:chromosome segregation ATPase
MSTKYSEGLATDESLLTLFINDTFQKELMKVCESGRQEISAHAANLRQLERNVDKKIAELTALTEKIAAAQERHKQLEMSIASLNVSLQDLKLKIFGSVQDLEAGGHLRQ